MLVPFRSARTMPPPAVLAASRFNSRVMHSVDGQSVGDAGCAGKVNSTRFGTFVTSPWQASENSLDAFPAARSAHGTYAECNLIGPTPDQISTSDSLVAGDLGDRMADLPHSQIRTPTGEILPPLPIIAVIKVMVLCPHHAAVIRRIDATQRLN